MRPACLSKLYVSKICYYEFASERKLIRHCINQNPPQNLRLKAEIKSTSLILQTAKESRKPGGRGSPLHGLYRYVRPQRVVSVLKWAAHPHPAFLRVLPGAAKYKFLSLKSTPYYLLRYLAKLMTSPEINFLF